MSLLITMTGYSHAEGSEDPYRHHAFSIAWIPRFARNENRDFESSYLFWVDLAGLAFSFTAPVNTVMDAFGNS